MGRSFPADVIVLDNESILHARFDRGRKDPVITQAKSWPLPAGTITPGPVTPVIQNEAAITEAIQRMKLEAGRLDRASLLLSDSWFKINVVDLEALPEKKKDADQVVRWALKRTLPVKPGDLRLNWMPLPRAETTTGERVLVVAALEQSLAGVEAIFQSAGINVVLIESLGLNIWNTITAQESSTQRDRLFLHFRERDFMAALFRGGNLVFIRSRNLTGDRALVQEIKLSAYYLRANLQPRPIETCYLAANQLDRAVADAVAEEFAAPVRTVNLKDYAIFPGEIDPSRIGAELTACVGVFNA